MKPSERILPLLGSIALLAPAARATPLHKANNNTALNVAGSWTENAIPDPGGADSLVFDNTITSVSTGTGSGGGISSLGSALSVAGITVTNPTINTATNVNFNGVVIGNATAAGGSFQLTLGSGGIDMSTATAPLYVGGGVLIGANQTWTVADASLTAGDPANPNTTFTTGNRNSPFALSQREDLVFSAVASTQSAPTTGINNNFAFDLGGKTVTTAGAGSIVIHAGYTVANGTINIGNGDSGQGTPFNGTTTFNGGGSLNAGFVIQSGGTRNSQINADVTLNVATMLKLQTNSGSMLSLGTINLGYNGTSNVNGAILQLVGANSTAANALTVGGSVIVGGTSTILAANTSVNGANTVPITISGNLSGSGALTLQNTLTNASAFFVLSGDNSGYSGAVSVNGPSGNRYVRLNSTTAGSAAATWSIAAGNAIQVNVAGGTVDLGTLNSNAGEGTVLNPTAATSTTVRVGAGDFGGVLAAGTGTLGLIKATPGTLTLRGANTYNGTTVVNAGTLATAGTGTLGFSNISIANGTILTLNSAVSFGDGNTLTFDPGSTINMDFTGSDTLTSITRSGGLTLSNAGTYSAAQLNTFFGGTSFASATGGTFTIVPEPGTAILGGLGLLTLFRRRRA